MWKKVLVMYSVINMLFMPMAKMENEQRVAPIESYLNTLTVYSMEEKEVHIAITGYQDQYNAVWEAAFLSHYPNGKIVYHYYTIDQLNTLLLARNESIDLVIISPQIMRAYAKQGVIIDLYQTELMGAWPECWIEFQNEAEIDGRLYGIPQRISQYYWVQMDELLKGQNQEPLNDIKSWSDFKDYAFNLSYDINGDGNKDFRLIQGLISKNAVFDGMIDDFFREYLYAEILEKGRVKEGGTFNTEQFKQLVEMYAAFQQKQILGRHQGAIPLYRGEKAVLINSIGLSGSFKFAADGFSVILPPVNDCNNPRYLGTYRAICLLKSAPNREAALCFLSASLDVGLNAYYEDFAQFFMKEKPLICVYPTYNQSTYFDDKTGEKIVAVTKGNIAIDSWSYEACPLSITEFERYSFARKNVVFDTQEWNLVNKRWSSLLEEYLKGVITFEELAEAMDQAVDMVINE